jgi:GntR family transcriptional repressor for pyruvate dehydrogenase complex
MERLDARPKRYEDAAEAIRRYIDEQELQPGDPLPSERQIQSQLGISRASVREALRILQMMGLIEARHGKGLYVAESNLQPIVDAYISNLSLVASGSFLHMMELRELLEIGAADLAAKGRMDEDLAAMRVTLDDLRARLDHDILALEADLRFHDALIAATRNPLLERLYAAIAPFLVEIRNRSLKSNAGPEDREENWRLGWSEHVAIYQAIEAQDASRAVELMRSHLEGVRLDLRPELLNRSAGVDAR